MPISKTKVAIGVVALFAAIVTAIVLFFFLRQKGEDDDDRDTTPQQVAGYMLIAGDAQGFLVAA